MMTDQMGNQVRNQIPRKNPFWSLAGPFMGYVAIQWGVQLVLQFLIQAPYAAHAYAEILRSETALTSQEVMDAFLKAMEPALEASLRHQVEVAGIAALCTLILTGIFFARDRKQEKICQVAVPERAPVTKYWTLLAFGIAGCVAATSLLTMAQIALYDVEYQETAQNLYSAGLPVQILCLGIVIPLAEEMMFRGILFKRFRERRTFWYSALCSALFFSFMHTNTTQMIYAFLLGIMLAYVYEKFGSVRAPLVLHIVMNCTSVVLTELGVFIWLVAEPVRISAASIVGAFLCSVVFVRIQRVGEPLSGNASGGGGDGQQNRFW